MTTKWLYGLLLTAVMFLGSVSFADTKSDFGMGLAPPVMLKTAAYTLTDPMQPVTLVHAKSAIHTPSNSTYTPLYYTYRVAKDAHYKVASIWGYEPINDILGIPI